MTAALRGEPVSAVLFDYGGTLVTFERPVAALGVAYTGIERYLREQGFSPPPSDVLLRDVHDRVERAFTDHQRSGSLVEINLVAEARRAYAELGLTLDEVTLDEALRMEQVAWWEGVTVNPEAAPTLEALRTRGLRVGLCSNAPYRIRSMYDQLAHFGLDRHLDAITFSGQVGWRKPSPLIFEAALHALGAAAAATMMVGDSVADDINGASAAGMRTIWLRRRQAVGGDAGAANAAATIDRLSAISALLFGTAAL